MRNDETQEGLGGGQVDAFQFGKLLDLSDERHAHGQRFGKAQYEAGGNDGAVLRAQCGERGSATTLI